jgi:tRNA-Thr(GGU) m(6)t(6)A37 methyltransferase TsaA
MNREEFTVKPIGYVRTGEGGTRLEIQTPYRPALRGLAGFSHIVVLWWCHLTADDDCRAITEWEQPYRNGPPVMGVFATRSPLRPNPIALTAVFVQEIDYERGIIQIPYIDAEDGTPILDLKPYHPSADRIRDVAVPEWCAHWPQWYEDSPAFDWEAEFVNAR